MPKPPYLSDILHGYDDSFSTLSLDLLGVVLVAFLYKPKEYLQEEVDKKASTA